MVKTHDTGLAPEGYLLEKTGSQTVYAVAQNQEIYPIEKILLLNDHILKSSVDEKALTDKLSDSHELIRYWAAVSLHYIQNPTNTTIEKLKEALKDESLLVQLAAAETLCAYGLCTLDAQQIILKGLFSENEAEMLYASRIYELHKGKTSDIRADVMKFYQHICEQSDGNWKGYDLYACWAMTEAFK